MSHRVFALFCFEIFFSCAFIVRFFRSFFFSFEEVNVWEENIAGDDREKMTFVIQGGEIMADR